MIESLLTKVFGTQHERDVKKMRPLVEAINALEPEMEALVGRGARGQDRRVPGAARQGRRPSTTSCSRAFAAVREAGRRTLGMRHYDVQLIGGMVLHQGKIAEMKTGEGKTLVATLPVYLNALAGKGVHVVTVNDYLARRDAEWMGRSTSFLGLTVGVIQHDMPDAERKQAYGADITYGTTTSSASTTCATT